MATGAAGGAAGLAGLAIELPVSTTLMLRSIADLARAEGEDLSSVATRLECLTVFAYGSPSPADNAADSAYFAMRAALARAVVQAAQHLSERGFAEAVSERATPALVQLVGRIAQRFRARRVRAPSQGRLPRPLRRGDRRVARLRSRLARGHPRH
jgi:hypothetical protein